MDLHGRLLGRQLGEEPFKAETPAVSWMGASDRVTKIVFALVLARKIKEERTLNGSQAV